MDKHALLKELTQYDLTMLLQDWYESKGGNGNLFEIIPHHHLQNIIDLEKDIVVSIGNQLLNNSLTKK